MNKFRRVLALLLSVCLSFSLALAEDATQSVTDVATDEVTQAVATADVELADTDVVATVAGSDVTWAEVANYYQSLINYYGEPDESMVDLYKAVAMEEAVTMKLVTITATENGLNDYSQDELDAIYAQSDADWQVALDNYVDSAYALTDESTEEEKATAYAEAEAYYSNLGYSKDILRQNYLDNETYTRVENFVCQGLEVTDDEVQAQYDANVESDKALYENDIDSYEYQMMLYNYNYADEKPWYHPNGYRYVKHILLSVDAELLAAYTDLQARLEEQMEAETATEDDTTDATADTTDAADTTEETPVTEADVDNAKANILASIQDKTDEIYAKISEGADFDELIAQYAVDADGNATDPGMTSGDYPDGYEVSLASSNFVPEFVAAAFSVDEIGDVSAPYVSDYGVHIVKYVGDVPSGAVELTDELKESIRASLLADKQSAAMDAWQSAADIQYTGLVKSYDEVAAEEDTAE